MSDPALILVNTYEDAQRFWDWMRQPHDWLSVDTESAGLIWWRDELRLVQIGDPDTGWAFPWQGWGGIAKQAIESYQNVIAMHNSKHDLHMLEHNGVKVPRHLVHDTQAMIGLIEPRYPKGLKAAGSRHIFESARIGDKMLKESFSKNKWDWATIPIEQPEYWGYSALDPVLCSGLARKFYGTMQQHPARDAYNYEVAVAQVLCDMEKQGLLVDNEYCRHQVMDLEGEELQWRQWFKDNVDVDNPFSDAQLIRMFETYGYVFTEETDKGRTRLDKLILAQIAVDRPNLAPLVEAVQKVRKCRKNRTTYFEAFLELQTPDHRVHTQINPMGAKTGRTSSERPNLQNVPSREQGAFVRRAFITPEGHKLISADFDQIEYRIMVSRAGEDRLIEAINAGHDLHTYMTAVVYQKPIESVTKKERSIMKNANFAFLYGAGNEKFARMAGIEIDEAKEFRNTYEVRFPAIARYGRELDHIGRTSGGTFTDYMGRPQVLMYEDKSASYKLINYVTQGEAGDVLKKSLVHLSMTEIGQYLRLPIHDEIIFEVPDQEVDQAVEIIKAVMPENDYYDVPLTVGVDVLDHDWGEKYD